MNILVISSDNKGGVASLACIIVAWGICLNSMHRRDSNRNSWDTPWFIWFCTLRRVDDSMGDDDFNLDARRWVVISRCKLAARLIFPHSQSSQGAWSLMAYRKWTTEGVPPEVLRDKRCPDIKELH